MLVKALCQNIGDETGEKGSQGRRGRVYTLDKWFFSYPPEDKAWKLGCGAGTDGK